MNKNIDILRDMVTASIYRNESITESEIDDLISFSAKAPIFKNNPLTDEDINYVRKQIHSEYLIRLELGLSIVDKGHVKWFDDIKPNLEMKYWNRYKNYLLQDKKFPVNVVRTMDEVSDELTDLLGNPHKDTIFQRRGLIIGDVQSGKTANYTGLICKAADAGYKVVVLLTGTIEKLRQQTQMRLDEGFIGMDSDGMLKQKEDIYVGVGKHDNTLHPAVFTSKSDDFNTKFANNLRLSLNALSEPVLFVIKKNVTVLKRLNQWLKVFNLHENSNMINTSLLMIDDEADNASINVNPEDCDPTATNFQIREMLSVFKRASYVGFTATPFANIFINPNTSSEMVKEDLFPKDYIYSLDAPTNYIGARNIFGENANYSFMLKEIDDGDIFYPLDHKIDFNVKGISKTLREAINEFMIVNVIRDLRGDTHSHRSMIVNCSRFVNVQRQLSVLIDETVEEIKNSVRLYGNLPIEEAIKDNNIELLYNTFNNDYSHLEFSWNEILNNMYDSILNIEVALINGKSYKTLNYDENDENGLRVIVVGGMGLSRGLTLEGLVISYFYRNSKMYDTLMQMGRWFGYRNNYDDICRIWMDKQNIEWYQNISDATDELRIEIKRMRELNKTPLEFGLRVRNDINSLLVTAKNKMRTASSVERAISLSETYLETTKLYNDELKNKTNLLAINNLLNDIKDKELLKTNYGIGYKDVDKKLIIDFINNYDASYANFPFDTYTIMNFIMNYSGNDLDNWDIVFLNGKSDKYLLSNDLEINCVGRSFISKDNGKLIQISGQRNRLGSVSDGKFGLDEKTIERIENDYAKYKPGVTVPQREYFRVKRNPLLMIYLVRLLNDKSEEKFEIKVTEPFVAISVGFPSLSNTTTQFAKYKINLIELKNIENYEYGEVDEDE